MNSPYPELDLTVVKLSTHDRYCAGNYSCVDGGTYLLSTLLILAVIITSFKIGKYVGKNAKT